MRHANPLVGVVTLLLLPGLDGTGALLEPFAAALAALGLRARIVRYPPRVPLSIDALAAQVLADLPPGPFALLGESFSGPVALRVARARPRELKALVLVASFVTPPLSRALGLGARVALALPPPGLGLRALLLGLRAPRAEVAALQRTLREVSYSVLLRRVGELGRLDARADLSDCPVPLLYLRASADRLVSAGTAAALAQLRPDLRVEVIEAPHLLLQRQPQAAAARVAVFLGEVAPELMLGSP